MIELGAWDVLYSIGEKAENSAGRTVELTRSVLMPTPSDHPPSFKLTRKQWVTPHETISLALQLATIFYLAYGLVVTFLKLNPLFPLIGALVVFLIMRYLLISYKEYILNIGAYMFFYYGILTISAGSFVGYSLLIKLSAGHVFYYGYLVGVLIAVLIFRQYFKSHYGRDYTYGIVEEVKNDLIRVFVHDDIAANVKPGYYWVPAVPDAEPGRVVKLLIEERNLRGSVPVRVLEVYLSSSQSSIEPKEQTE